MQESFSGLDCLPSSGVFNVANRNLKLIRTGSQDEDDGGASRGTSCYTCKSHMGVLISSLLMSLGQVKVLSKAQEVFR